jgi:hypothetical protein
MFSDVAVLIYVFDIESEEEKVYSLKLNTFIEGHG